MKISHFLTMSFLATLATFAQAQQKQSLEEAASDPTASLAILQIADWYTFKYHDSDNLDDNSVVLRAAYPFKIGQQQHIMRVTAPVITSHPVLHNGLSDTSIFDLMVFDASWGRWGAGAVALVPTGGDTRGTGQWAVGPAVGFTAQGNGFLWGLFNQNAFTFAGDNNRTKVNSSSFEPIFSHNIGNGWTTGFSEMQVTYDWERSRWSSLPLGWAISKLQKIGGLPIQMTLQYEHNFADYARTPSDTVRFAVKLLLPTM